MPEEHSEQSTRTSLRPEDVKALYERCKSNELLVTLEKWNRLKEFFVQELAFGPPLFGSGPEGQDLSLGEKYVLLRGVLDQAKKCDEIWRVLANWLKSEEIRMPKDWLPKGVFEQLTKKTTKKVNQMQWPDFYYHELIDIWQPYVRAFLQEAEAPGNVNSANRVRRLQNLGFEPSLIAASGIGRWRSEISLTCEWLAERGVIQPTKRRANPDTARTLRNAYSRISATNRRFKLNG